MSYYFDSCMQADDFATQNNSFGLFFSDERDPSQSEHVHECCEVCLCLSGGKSFLINGTQYGMADGDLFIINPTEPHRVTPNPQKAYRRYVLHVHPSFLFENSTNDTNLSDCFYSSRKLTRIPLSPQEVRQFIDQFESLKGSLSYGDDLQKKLQVLKLLLSVSAIVSGRRKKTPAADRHKSVQLAMDYINTHYKEPLTLDAIAKSAFVSPSQLSRLFTRYCGITVSRYIINKRLAEAQKHLKDGKSVGEAAQLCGFNDYANFIRTFTKHVGISPGKYKNAD